MYLESAGTRLSRLEAVDIGSAVAIVVAERKREIWGVRSALLNWGSDLVEERLVGVGSVQHMDLTHSGAGVLMLKAVEVGPPMPVVISDTESEVRRRIVL